jgi:hypothetical protein
MRNIVRRYLTRLVLVVPVAALSSCAEITGALIDRGQIDHVNASVWPNVIEVGDTISASADAFNANGIMTAWLVPRVWRVSDGSVVELLGGAPPQAEVILSALRPGTSRVFARIGDHEASDSLRVIPRLAPITFTPSAVSMRVGDSVYVTAELRTTAGDAVTGVGVRWHTDDPLVVGTGCCSPGTWLRSSPQFGVAGTASVTATVGHAAGALLVTVTR